MPRAVQFHRYGGPEELRVDDVPSRTPSDDDVVVRVRAAGVNPGEAAIREGEMDSFAPAHFPSGQGTEFAGIVLTVGAKVHDVAVGDEVIGFSDGRDAQADEVVLPASHVLPKPKNIGWDTAAIIPIAGATAVSMVASVRPHKGETIVVAGAAGGVGFVAAQLLLRQGVTVIGTAGTADQDALTAHGIHAVVYGDGVEGRIRRAAPHGIDAFLDTHGAGQADLAIALGVSPDRIDSIIDFESGQRLGIRNEGMYQLPDIRSAVVEFAHMVASGEIELPVRASFPLEGVKDAYQALASGPGIGKVVLDVSISLDAPEDIATTEPVRLFAPGAPEYESATSPENSTASQHPAFVARPLSTDEVVAVVREARERGLVVVPQATGHGAGGQIGDDTVVIDTSALTELVIDPDRRMASAGVGLTWGAINTEAERDGLLGLAGSSPSVGIAGFTFGGGFGWLTRAHGTAASALRGVEYVDGTGTIRHASEDAVEAQDRDALWAFRGGGGVGIATRLEFDLFPVTEMFAGYLLWPISALEDVVAAWSASQAQLGESVATSIAVLHTPPAPLFPPALQGVPVVHLAIASPHGEAVALPLLTAVGEAATPAVDTWGAADAAKLGGIHLDPPSATPALGIARWLSADAPHLASAILGVAADQESPLALIEIRSLGNSAQAREGAGARVGGPYALHCVGALFDPLARERIEDSFAEVITVATPVDLGRSLGSWVEGADSVPDALAPADRQRVGRIADAVDPSGLISRSRFIS